jgi:PAS domain S-box-containing protein
MAHTISRVRVADFDRFIEVFSTRGAAKRAEYGCRGVSLYYTNNQKWFTAPVRWTFITYVLVTIAIVFTNPLHHWYWTEITIVDGFPETQSEHGFYFWIYAVGTYLLILSSVALYIIHYFRVSPFFRRQAVLMVLGGFIPLAARIPEDFLGLDIIPKLDNIIVFLLVSAILFFIAIFRYSAFEILPIAHDLVVQNINSGILVLNTTGYIVEINPYARMLIGSESSDAIGKPLNIVLKDWPKLEYSPQLTEQLEQEVSLSRNDRMKHFLVRISPIHDKRDTAIGHVIVLVDITERRFAEMELERMARTDVLTNITNRRHSCPARWSASSWASVRPTPGAGATRGSSGCSPHPSSPRWRGSAMSATSRSRSLTSR